MPSSIIKIKRQYKVGVEKAAHKDSISAFFCTLAPKGSVKKESGRPVIKKSKEGREREKKNLDWPFRLCAATQKRPIKAFFTRRTPDKKEPKSNDITQAFLLLVLFVLRL